MPDEIIRHGQADVDNPTGDRVAVRSDRPDPPPLPPPAQPALNAVDPDGAAVTNAAPANGYDFLGRAGFSRRHIGAVLERAATLGTTPRRALLQHEGHIAPERYTAALARDAAPGSPGASAMYRAAPSASTLLDRASKRRARRSHGHGRRGTRCALRWHRRTFDRRG